MEEKAERLPGGGPPDWTMINVERDDLVFPSSKQNKDGHGDARTRQEDGKGRVRIIRARRCEGEL